MTNVVLGIAAGGYRSQMVKGWSSRFSNAGINCLAEQCPAGQYAVACIDAGSIVSKGEFFPPERIRCVDAGRYRKNNKFDWARACWDLRMETVFSCEGTEKTPAVVCDPGQICNRNNLACLSNGVAVTSGTLASSPDIVSPINAAAVPTDSGEKGGDTQLGASTDNKATDHKE